MKKFFLLIVLTIFFIQCKKVEDSQLRNNQMELKNLDLLINEKPEFRIKKQEYLNVLKINSKALKDSIELYKINNEIIENYLGFQSDSAFKYINKNFIIAKHQQNEIWKQETLIKKAVLLSSTGLFSETRQILDSIKPILSKDLEFSYNSASESLYTNLYDYSSKDVEFSEKYKKILLGYYRNGYSSLGKESYFSYLFAFNIDKMLGDWDNAEKNIDIFIEKSPNNNRLKAIGYYCKALVSKNKQDYLEQEKYLALSAIEDIKSATTENRSMQELAYLMYEKKDYQRAFKYLQCAVYDANFYNARHRNFQISQVYPIIEKSYMLEINNKSNKLKKSIVIISLLLISLGIVIYFLFKQLKVISKSRNESLKLNKTLNLMNLKLNESNRIKDTYMAYFITQSGKYFDRFDRFKNLISAAVDSNNTDKIKKLISDKRNTEINNEKFYKEFDEAFLNIYPHFVTEINKLMKPKCQYSINKGLNTELRIFALIRLGINDVNQISEFLRYSLRTIYNYKSKVKSKSVIENDDFEREIMKIDAIS